jgi:hypothetical protein
MRYICSRRTILFLLTAILLPTAAYADAGTPLLWAGIFQLSIGNLLIGLLEAFAILHAFRPKRNPYGIMIAANYFSAFVGAAVLALCGFMYGHTPDWVTIYNARTMILVMWIVSFVLSVVLEWPFCFWIFKGQERSVRTSVLASLLAQTVSYAVLIPFLTGTANLQLYKSYTVERPRSFAKEMHGTVYFLSPKDGNVYRIRPGDTTPRLAFATHDRTGYPCMVPRKIGDVGSCITYDLRFKKSEKEDGKLLISSAAEVRRDSSDDIREEMPKYMVSLDLRPSGARKYRVLTDPFPGRGLLIREANLGSYHTTIAFESPVISWHSSFASVLPGDYIVYALGHQILVVDMNKRKVGLLAIGERPVAVPDKQ